MALSIPFLEAPSPNHGPRAAGVPLAWIVLHYTGMETDEAALRRLCDPQAKVSAHFMIEEDGRMFLLVDPARRAWHAGRGFWRGIRDVNSASIGIELVNPGHEHGYRPFPQTQIDALCALLDNLSGQYGIPRTNLLGHSDVAPGRKEDPGELFPWRTLAERGFGIFPDACENTAAGPDDETRLAEILHEIGYDPDVAPEDLLTAFARHYAPQALADLSPARLLPVAHALQSVIKNAT